MKNKIKSLLPKDGRRMKIADIKKMLPENNDLINIDLKMMHLDGEIQLVPGDDPLELTDEDRANFVIFGPEKMFFVKLI